MSSQHYRKKSSKRTEWSDWGPWVWSQTYERYYRQRQDISGNIETMWATERNTPAAAEPRNRPEEDQDALTDRFGRIDLDEEEGEEESAEAEYQEYSHRPSSHSSGKQKSKSSSSKGKSKTSSSSSSKKKPKAAYTPEDPIEEQEGEDEAAAAYEGGKDAYEGDASTYPYYATDASGGGYRQSYQTSAYPGAYGEEHADDQHDPAYEEARKQSLQEQHSRHPTRGGESSRHQESSRHASRRGQHAEYATAEYPAGEYEYDQASEGAITPRATGKFDISGNEGDYEALDPRYRVEPSHKFQPGEVFKVLWPEPTGQTVGGTPTISDTQKIKNKYGESFYVGFRRFIVIANDHGHCQCVPILTYQGKGCLKRGVKADKHGIVYDERYRARPLPDEPKMGFIPVRLTLEVEGESLAKASRVNYSKIVTVEHNVKVFFIGHIRPEDYQNVSDAVNRCWEDKIFQRKKQHPRG